jgi:two-component system CheB/CheR fusion protein
LRLTGREPVSRQPVSVDVLLQSLAEEQGYNAIGVILSGSGSDGARGMEAIKGAGGITFAQDPASARFASMPKSAIETGCVDFILAPPAIARELTRIGRHPYMNGGAGEGAYLRVGGGGSGA